MRNALACPFASGLPGVGRHQSDLDLIHADLARMHLNRRDSVSVLSALVEARASGRTLDDLNGKVTVGDVVYRYNADTLRTTRLTLDGQNSAAVCTFLCVRQQLIFINLTDTSLNIVHLSEFFKYFVVVNPQL